MIPLIGAVVMGVAARKLASVMGSVEYRISYSATAEFGSLGAVHCRVQINATHDTLKSVIVSGGWASVPLGGVKATESCILFDGCRTGYKLPFGFTVGLVA